MAHAFLVTLGLLVWLGAFIGGCVAGFRIARLIPTAVPAGMSELGVSEVGFQVSMWLLRAFIFLMMIVVVTAPVLLLFIAIG